MTRPDIACLCVERGVHAAITVGGPTRGRMIAAFRADHTGPGHVAELPPRSWYGKEAQIAVLLQRMAANRSSEDAV